MTDFVASLEPGTNRLYEILRMERDGDSLSIVLGCSDGPSRAKRVCFHGVTGFEHTLFGAPGDTAELPQNLIGFDYWGGDEAGGAYDWELNGDECTWNFRAPLPTVVDCSSSTAS
jgi:hypothetical protein